MIWHSNSANDVLQELRVDPEVGLTAQDVSLRLEEHGHNTAHQWAPRPLLQECVAQLRAPLTAVLLAVASVLFVVDLYTQILQGMTTHWYVPLSVAVLTVLSAFMSALRKRRAESLTEWTHTLSAPDIRVRRDGTEQMVSTLTLVPGDIVLLCAGDIVPADCRLITAEHLQCDESVLTGDATTVAKNAEALFDNITPLAQRTNMVFAGTTVTAGTATVVVVATGMRSEMGHEKHRVPLTTQKENNLTTILLQIGAVLLGVIALVAGLIGHDNRSAVLLIAATLTATLVPPGINALYARLNAGSIQRLLCHRVRIITPATAKALGRVSVVGIPQDMLCEEANVSLCRAYVGHRMVDLTQDQPQAPGLSLLLRMTALNTTDTTLKDTAILARLHQMGIDREELLTDMPRIGAISSANGHQTTVHVAEEQTLILVSGAWRTLLPLCNKGNVEEWTTAATEMEQEGLQVVAIAYRLTNHAPAEHTAETLKRDLVCAGLLGLHIPVRQPILPDPKVRTILFSHDSADMACSIAKRVGLTATEAVTAESLLAMDDRALATAVGHYDIYCGLDTAQKARVITALQKQGQSVAFVTDRADEAELLHTAHVGMARGTQADNRARAAADLILCHDEYVTITTAISDGRRLCREKKILLVYLLIYGAAVLSLGFGGLLGAISLTDCARYMSGLYLPCAASPAPLLITFGISNAIQKLREK